MEHAFLDVESHAGCFNDLYFINDSFVFSFIFGRNDDIIMDDVYLGNVLE